MSDELADLVAENKRLRIERDAAREQIREMYEAAMVVPSVGMSIGAWHQKHQDALTEIRRIALREQPTDTAEGGFSVE